MAPPTYRQHETAFCAEVSKWCDKLFETKPDLPFGSSDIESFGRGSQKRQDFRVYERSAKGRGKLALCGEVKLPGSQQGHSPFDMRLMQDAFNKATAEGCRYFFTWNVEHLALFDRAHWDTISMHERCIGECKLGLELNKPEDVTRTEVKIKLQEDFLPRFFAQFAEIWSGRMKDFGQPPSDVYVAIIESHLTGPMGPVRELRDYLGAESSRNSAFRARLRSWMAEEQQWNVDPTDLKSWPEAIDRAARSMAYVLSNRILFYQAVRLRNELPELRLPRSAKTPEKAYQYLRTRFEEAVHRTGDYEPVFFPETREWAAVTALSGANSIEAWGRFILALERFSFKEIPTDILGHTFQKLISPEERHKFGQFYTDENIVDLINAFCIRKGGDVVFDPACGSGTFLVRAYYRKSYLDRRLSNQELLEGLYGCDINPFPAHLTTLNLAARNITQEENYPRIVRKNFFAVSPDKPFCEIPTVFRDRDGNRERQAIELPELDAVVGNPPYVKHEHIPKASDKGAIRDQTKEHLYETVERAWPGIKLSKQSDIHVYFWPAAARFLKEGARFGFLTSSSWLDVRYGFQLQRWLLLNFRIEAVIESVDEVWFEDARVKTAVTIFQRCSDETKRNENLVRFVRLKKPLAEILGERTDEDQRQEAAEKLRDFILKTKSDVSSDQLRIMVKRQGDLWQEGLSVAEMFAKHKMEESAEDEDAEDNASDEADEAASSGEDLGLNHRIGDYGGGKWGRYLRAPDFYFEIMREFGERFTRLSEIATIKRGITSGCDAFFMPRNVSAELLAEHPNELAWKLLPLMRRCTRKEVESGEVVIVKCGDGTLHPIEREFVRPEVHSLMEVDRPVVTPDQLDRVVLWVTQDLKELKGTYASHYITWGSKQTFASKKSKAVPLPQRATVAGRDPWYDLTGLAPGVGFWPKSQQYRHIIPANTYKLNCNCNLYDLHPLTESPLAVKGLMPILNSTVVALFKTFYGRYAGTEGNLKTEIVDVMLVEIPDPRNLTEPLLNKMHGALDSMQKREVTHLVEEAFLKCHTAGEVREAAKLPLGLPVELKQTDRRQLDDAVFELLGVKDAAARATLIDRLYREVSFHFRSVRIVEVQKMEQRRHGSGRSVSQMELALDAWNELEPEWQQPLSAWLDDQTGKAKTLNFPDGEVRLPAAENFFESTTVYFGKKPAVSHVGASRAEAELVYAIAHEGLRGPVSLPATEKSCRELARILQRRFTTAKTKFEELAQQRAGSDKLREQVIDLLYRWFIHGPPPEHLPPPC
jgi:type I restriction-modification system DNA methylase subunit